MFVGQKRRGLCHEQECRSPDWDAIHFAGASTVRRGVGSMRTFLLQGMAAVLALAGCGSSDGFASSSDVVLSSARWPESANTYSSTSGAGCLPRSMLQICEVPDGSVLHADGSITTPAGQTVRCSPACNFSEYSLECYASPQLGAAIPLPADSLGCRAVPIPTSPNVLFYCCPGVP
jgi:hypothetical protein